MGIMWITSLGFVRSYGKIYRRSKVIVVIYIV